MPVTDVGGEREEVPLTFELKKGRFNFRVAAVIIREGQVLAGRYGTDGNHYWSLPGGRGELLESTRETLVREIREEMGVDAKMDRLLWTVENFYRFQGRQVHELAFYYLVHLPESSPICQKEGPFPVEEEGEIMMFQWIPLQEVKQLPLFPSFLRQRLAEEDLPVTPQHVVHTDEEH